MEKEKAEFQEASAKEKISVRRKELKISRMRTYFITAAEKIMREEGLQNITNRKVAQEAGFSSATLYAYFKDLDELILFASMKYREAYIKRLSWEIAPSMNSLEQYRRIYELFNFYTFRSPEIYLNMFFGRHSANLREITAIYYALFPGEMVEQYTDLAREVLIQNNVFDCDRSIAGRIAEEGFIDKARVEAVVNILVRTHESFMRELVIHPEKNPDEQSEAFMKIFDHVIETNRSK